MRLSAPPRRMTSPTDELHEDHATVCAGLGVLAELAVHVRHGGPFPAQDTAAVLSFLREFLVATHFRKENEVVWPALAMRADDEAAATVGQITMEQEETIELINTLVVFWEPAGELTPEERQGFADTVDALHTRARLMMANEERLFCACNRDIPPDDRIDWSEQFAAIAQGRTARGTWTGRLRRLAARWVD